MRSGSLHQKNYETQFSINSMLKDEIRKKKQIKRMRAKYNIKKRNEITRDEIEKQF